MWWVGGLRSSLPTTQAPTFPSRLSTYFPHRAQTMTSDEQKAGFDLIKKARQQHALMAPSKASLATLQEYEREFDRIVGERREATDIWRAVITTDSKRTYYRRAAALRHGVRTWLSDYLRHQDSCQRAGDWNSWQKSLESIDALLELDELVTKSAGHCPLATPKRRASKRQHLSKFPANWRDQLAARFRCDPYEAVFLICALTGCRPHELERPRGINVTATSDGVLLSVRGAKVKDDTQGQEWRIFDYGDHPFVLRLREILNMSEGATVSVAVESKVKWTTILRGFGWSLWPITVKAKDKEGKTRIKKIEVTPYLLRHALASDWKRQGWDLDEISAGLGHVSSKTRSLYGHWSSGGSSPLGLKGITAAKPVRSAERIPMHRSAGPKP